jgi:hypothetical protein
MPVITNNVPRLIVDGFDLTPQEREEFDYIDWVLTEKGEESREFFRYKGEIYDLGDFMYINPDMLPAGSILKGWDGYINDTMFSGILVKHCEDHDHVIVGRFYE